MITRIEQLSELSDINIAFWVYSRTKKTFQYISPRVNTIFETNIEKTTDIGIFRKIVHPEDQTRVIRNLNGGIGSVDELDYRIITPKGKTKWLKNTAIAIQKNINEGEYVIGCTYPKTRLKTEVLEAKNEINSGRILETLPDSFIVMDKNEKIIHAHFSKNEHFLINSAYTSIKGKKLNVALNTLLTKKIKDKLKENSIAKNASFEIEINKNNSRNWLEIRLLKFEQNAILIIIRNVTELLSKINDVEKFYNITQQSQDLVMITDVTGTIEYINPMVTKTTGYTAKELVGKNASIFKSEKNQKSAYVELWKTILSGKSFKGEFINLKKDGTHYIEEKIITPLLNINGQITNFISTGKDVTLQRRKEQKRNKYKQLEETINEKEQKSRTLSLIKSNEIERKKFARDIHEGVNQMLTAAMANLESLSAKNIISDDEKNKIELINQMVSEITNDLRGISTGLSPIGMYKFGLFPIIDQKIKKTAALYPQLNFNFSSNINGLRFKNEIEINLYRIVIEAIENIIKHSNAKKVNLILKYTDNNLILQIKDNGKGINMNNLEFKKMSTYGILNIEARAKSIGALLTIKSCKDKGFLINLSLNTKKLHHD